MFFYHYGQNQTTYRSLNIPNGRFTLEICDDVNIVVPVLRPLQIRWNHDDTESLSIHTTLGEDFFLVSDFFQ